MNVQSTDESAHTDERTHHRKLVRHKTSRRHAWGEGIWNFYVERLVVFLLDLCIFPAASYETAEENQVKRRNRLGTTTIDQVD